ncbi:aminotransferase class V-fold PLP-dependent enzyme [Methylobacterium dankookense]|uniref:Cysteine desulfurase n=1 Tax=Methylobacterium dankookense TaxID=560405 RepID=A0A564G7L7_9HYPH|nr:aminotransferase class V-fold PLP-dependent enzyme [Methylobacterium dankookense]GJD59004.1 putative cysteine desulfurase [Methylobacterium dankookense]VUF16052.1 putative cysteine desulfurase [Methylobacterium dankookense]
MSGLDIARLRAETPGTAHGIHLNNAGAALMAAPVVEAVKAHLDLEARHGGHGAAERAADRLAAVHGSVARLIGAAPDEIALTESATRAWLMGFHALARTFGPGDRILASRAEFGANVVALRQVARATGVRVEAIPCDAQGRVDCAALARRLGPDVRLIAATAIPSNGGLVNPVAEIGRLARAHGIPYLLDACQMVGQRPVDVAEIGCTLLAATGRKFLRGPRGTGFLYVRRDWIDRLEPVMLDHFGAPLTAEGYTPRTDARRFETYEHDHAARLGLGVAADYALALGLDAIAERCTHLAGLLRAGIAAIPGAVLHDLGPDPAALVTLTLAGIPAEAVRARLADSGIAAGLSLHAAAPDDAAARSLPPLLRLSPHYYNDADEIARTLAVLARIAARA